MTKKNYYLESVFDLNANNVWGVDANELLELWQKDVKDESFSSSEEKILNVIRLAFDVHHYDLKDEREVKKYSTPEYVILPSSNKQRGAVAINKREISQITDLSYENIKHITAAQLLALIERNFGGGWESISLSIRDIIESAFDISTTTLPASRIHAPGGTLERKVNDGYDVLEVAKGSWVEAIFAKKRELVEKVRFAADEYDEEGNRRVKDFDDEEDDEEDDDDKDEVTGHRHRNDEDDDEDDDNINDETYYGSYTPEADIKDDDLEDE